MMGLALFQKTNCKRLWNIASYHSPHSLTWRWVFSFSLGWQESRRWWPLVMWDRHNTGTLTLVRIPWVGMFRLSTQRPIWYRDLHQSQREERDRLAAPKPAPTPPPKVIVDGGDTLH